MSEILKPCPFCPDGGDLQVVTFTGGADDVVNCHVCGTILKHKIWQTRPIENDLRNSIAELETNIRHNALWQASEDAEERAHLEKLVPDLKKRIAELEGLAQKLVWVGNDLLTDNTNPVTITLFSGLAFRSKELLP